MSANRAIHALTRPFTITLLLVGYIAAVAVGRWYVATIRYPWWRMADSTVLGLTLIELGWAVGMLLATPTIAIGAATAALSITFLLLLILQQKVAQPGLTVGLHSLAIFAICTGLHLALVSWQSIGTSVEYLAGGIGICLGIAVCIARLRHRVPRVAPITLPTGVSQRFRDTFTRALAPKQPSSKDGSSHGKK